MSKRYFERVFTILLLVIITIAFSSCTSGDIGESLEYGREYPYELFPIVDNATIYEYNYSNNIIDIKFGTDKSFEEIKEYYQLVFSHNDYYNTIDKLTNKRYLVAGYADKYSYLLEAEVAETKNEKQYFETVVNIRVVLNDIIDLTIDFTPTPQVIITNEPTPKSTPEPTSTPEIIVTPEPSEIYNLDESDFKNSIDLLGYKVFIQAEKATTELDNGKKEITIQLEIINYSNEETGYIDLDQICLIDHGENEYYPEESESIFDSGVNILAKGHAIGLIKFIVPETSNKLTLLAKHGIGNIDIDNLSINLYGEPSPLFSGDYYDMIKGQVDKRVLPTFITGQEHTFDDVLSLVINDAKYFGSDDEIDKYTYEVMFTNLSDNVIIPVEQRGFALYDVYHNILVKPTNNITEYDELGFNPVQSGVSKIYNISFEIFEEIDDEYLHLLVYSIDGNDNDILFTK